MCRFNKMSRQFCGEKSDTAVLTLTFQLLPFFFFFFFAFAGHTKLHFRGKSFSKTLRILGLHEIKCKSQWVERSARFLLGIIFGGQLQVACIFYLACLTETCSFHYGFHKLNVTLLKFPNDVYDDIPSSMYKGMDANGSSGVDELITNGFHLHL